MKTSENAPLRVGAGRKLAVVASIIAFTTGLSGYFMGLLQTDRSVRQREEPYVAPAPPLIASVPIAPAYRELADRTRQPNHGWRSQLADLAPGPALNAQTPPASEAELVRLQRLRSERRAYHGAPPTVPHPIDQQQSVSCLACHGKPTRIQKMDVPQMSHPAYTHCIQCHAPAHGPGLALASPPPDLATPEVANAFVGLPADRRGERAHAYAPPVVPHTTAMHQNCISCHGPGGSSVLKPTHPDRQNCLQCHALDAGRETLPQLVPPVPPPPAAL